MSNVPDDPDAAVNNDLPEGEVSADNNEISEASEITRDEVQATDQEGGTAASEIPRQQREATADAQDNVRRRISRSSTPRRRTQDPAVETPSSILMQYILDQKKDSSRETNHIDTFLSGIAETMKSLPPLYQHMAKSRIFNVVSEIELQVLMKTQTSSVHPVPETSQLLHNTPSTSQGIRNFQPHVFQEGLPLPTNQGQSPSLAESEHFGSNESSELQPEFQTQFHSF